MEEIVIKDETAKGAYSIEEEEEEEASVDIWRYVFGFAEIAVVRCAIELGLADALERNGGSMLLSELSSSVNCPPTFLQRIMRFLVHRKIFKETSNMCYTQTPLSRRLLQNHESSLAAFILFESAPPLLAPWFGLSNRVRETSNSSEAPFVAAHGMDLWKFTADNPSTIKLINDAMASDTNLVVPQITKMYPNLLDGVETLVDVGGADGTMASLLVKAFPWVRATNFDLPHVISHNVKAASNIDEKVQHVGGNMFDNVPKADVVILKFVLHDWGDDECIEILKKCKEATPKDNKGKVIIVEAVIDEEKEEKMQNVKLMLDMVMMAHTTNGKERTFKEWSYVLNKAGFNNFQVKPLRTVQSLIVAYP